MNLLQSLKTQIKQQGDLSFVEFMHKALYEPGLGYYSSGLAVLGKQGDFITGPEMSPLFGQSIANQCAQILPLLDSPILFEFGAGSGTLCVEILSHLERLNCLPKSYYILEVSAPLAQRQQEFIKKSIPHLAHCLTWIDKWPERPFNGIILANEVLDAMPVHRFIQSQNQVLESLITLDAQDNLQEVFKPSQNAVLLNYVTQQLPEQTTDYLSEANLFIDSWLHNIYQILNQGLVLLIDYGFPRHEYYHPDRSQGTLMCHYQHKAHTNPLIHVGEQDITAHVDFTHVAEAGFQAGFHIAGYTNQASFLLANGLLGLIESLDADNQFKAKQAIKQLTHPSEMGELFKVIALSKQIDVDLQGFQFNDKRVSL